MARVTGRVRAKKTAVRKGPARSSARSRNAAKTIANPRRAHDFLVNHLAEDDFKVDGLRRYARYRDLGIKDATHGMAVAHVIRFQGPCNPELVSKLHRHAADFQLIYVLKGSITSQFEGHGVHTMTAGDAWLQPKNIKHKVLDYSDDCEVLEIVMPANFKTFELEAKPQP
ncbi:MAG TPA: cupin domain-containing protein [Xanthobacteraceae bacterium]